MSLRSLLLAMCIFAMGRVAGAAAARTPIREYIIDLDMPPQHRYDHIASDLSNGFNASVWDFYKNFFNGTAQQKLFYAIAAKRQAKGGEPAEMEAEIDGLAKISRLPVNFVRSVQMLNEIESLMIPIVNFTLHKGLKPSDLPAGYNKTFDTSLTGTPYEPLTRLPWGTFAGCTGIIAKNSADGTVYHARNLDQGPGPLHVKVSRNT